jgi:hypothetical protein
MCFGQPALFKYLNRADVKQALHIDKKWLDMKFDFLPCKYVFINYQQQQHIQKLQSRYHEVIQNRLQYNGRSD